MLTLLQPPSAPACLTRHYATLIDWADGSHTLECLRADPGAAVRETVRLGRFWGPTNQYTFLRVTLEQWVTHRQPCRDRECGL